MVSMRFFFTFSSVAVAGTYSDTSYFVRGGIFTQEIAHGSLVR